MDDSVITKAMKEYGNTVLRAAYSVTSNRSEAEDVFSDVFFALFVRKEPFQSEEHLKAWLIRVAVNKAKNVRQSAHSRHKAELNDSIAAAVSPIERDCDLENALNTLKPIDRSIVYLHYYEGYSLREIAKTLKINELSIRSRISRSRKKLRHLLDD